jgi:hypothetical protein
MKRSQSSIVLIGHDEHLLETRQWVLQTRGYQVVSVPKVSAIRTIPPSDPVRLVVLCHTLSDRERKASVAAACSRWPGVKLLTLAAEPGRAPTGILGQLLHTMDGPAKLLALVSELIGSSSEMQDTPQVQRTAPRVPQDASRVRDKAAAIL